jgi:hypothetical protein
MEECNCLVVCYRTLQDVDLWDKRGVCLEVGGLLLRWCVPKSKGTQMVCEMVCAREQGNTDGV